jgi:hypothetical protein
MIKVAFEAGAQAALRDFGLLSKHSADLSKLTKLEIDEIFEKALRNFGSGSMRDLQTRDDELAKLYREYQTMVDNVDRKEGLKKLYQEVRTRVPHVTFPDAPADIADIINNMPTLPPIKDAPFSRGNNTLLYALGGAGLLGGGLGAAYNLNKEGSLEKEAGAANYLRSLRESINNRIADMVVGRIMPQSAAREMVEDALSNTGNIMDPIIQGAARKMVDEDPLMIALSRSIRG